jgi:hypothetical protein
MEFDMKKKRLVIAIGLALLVAAIPAAVSAGGNLDGRVVLGSNFTLGSGEVLNGDLVLLGGNADLLEGSLVDGDVFVMGGNADIEGEVSGNLGIMGGQVSLGGSAVIHGDITTFGGNLNADPDAVVLGDTFSDEGFSVPFDVPFSFNIPSVQSFRLFDSNRVTFAPILGGLWFVFRTVMLAVLAVLVVLIWPEPTDRMAVAAMDQALLSGGIGLLTLVIGPLLLIMLALVTLLILSPVSFLGGIVLVVAIVFGLIAVGLEVGKRIAEAFKWDLHPAATAGIGSLVIGLVVGGIGQIPCIGWLAGILVAALGLGGVILTRFGSREYVAMQATPKKAAPRKTTRKKSE